MKKQNQFLLYRYIRILKTKDNNHLRTVVFEKLKDSSLILRILSKIYEAGSTWMRAICLMTYGLWSTRKRPLNREVKAHLSHGNIGIVAYSNHFTYLSEQIPSENIIELRTNLLSALSTIMAICTLSKKHIIISVKVVKVCLLLANRKHRLLNALRSAELIFNYIFYPSVGPHINKVYISTDGCPLVFAFCLWAKKADTKIIYLTHGLVASDVPTPICDHFVFDCYKNYRTYTPVISQTHQITFYKKPIRQTQVDSTTKVESIGIVGSLLPDWKYVLILAQEIKLAFPMAKLYLRPHPNQIPKPPGHFFLHFPGSIGSFDLTECQLVFCGNSSYGLTLMGMGVCTLYDPKLDFAPEDLYGLVKDGIIVKNHSPITFNYYLKTVEIYKSNAYKERFQYSFGHTLKMGKTYENSRFHTC